MSSKENIKNYKSNKVFVEDGWRYSLDKHTHYKLDYRLVFTRHYCFSSDSFSTYNYPNGLNTTAHDFINDICTIGKNLGFVVKNETMDFQWEPGKEYIFKYSGGEFMRIRAYLNGNIHCKPNQDFIKKLNVEAARLNGWVKDQKEASKELDMSIADIQKYYKSNKKLVESNVKLLTDKWR